MRLPTSVAALLFALALLPFMLFYGVFAVEAMRLYARTASGPTTVGVVVQRP